MASPSSSEFELCAVASLSEIALDGASDAKKDKLLLTALELSGYGDVESKRDLKVAEGLPWSVSGRGGLKEEGEVLSFM